MSPATRTRTPGRQARTLLALCLTFLGCARSVTALHGADRTTGSSSDRHWAFEAIGTPTAPRVEDGDWCHGVLDRFVLRRLEDAGLRPSADAGRHQWLRRVTLDVTGLPPSPADVEAFASDNSPQARERVVDRLLASTAYGERWARHWLDLVGYADQLGTVNDVPAPHAWRYRDYVVRSFNTDKPFDQFIREQVAGDLLPTSSVEARRDALTATGFLLLGEIHIVTGDKLQLRADIVDHQIQKVGTTFLGLTLGCVRCHDHKFDPIRLPDYYGLAGIFGSSEASYVTDRGVWSSLLTSELPETPDQRAERQQLLDEHTGVAARTRGERLDLTNQLAEVSRQLSASTNALPAAASGTDAAQSKPASNLPDPTALKSRKSDLEKRIASLDNRLLHLAFTEPKAEYVYSLRDAEKPADGRVHVRGNPHAPGDTVPRGFIRVVGRPLDRPLPMNTSGRREFAEWLTSRDNPLTARVTVNRVWQKLFGEGIVRTVDYFGTRGEKPTHPELLDWLAGEFVRQGWSQKALIRSMVLSRAYAMDSTANPAAAARDPDNRLLWRMNRRRLDAEALRDSILTVSGQLEPVLGGPSLALQFIENVGGLDPKDVNPVSFRTSRFHDDQARRRTLYLPVVRSRAQPGPAEIRNLFDFVPPTEMVGQRPSTSVATQALFLMNSEFIQQHARKLAETVLASPVTDEVARLQQLYLRTLNRPATAHEIEVARQFIEAGNHTSSGADTEEPARRLASWAAYCHALLASNEFLFRL